MQRDENDEIRKAIEWIAEQNPNEHWGESALHRQVSEIIRRARLAAWGTYQKKKIPGAGKPLEGNDTRA